MEERATGNAARCRRWTTKRRAMGLVRVTVEVPAERVDDLRAVAAGMREAPTSTPTLAPPDTTPAPEPAPLDSWLAAAGRDWWAPLRRD